MSNPFNTLNPSNPYNTNNMAGVRNAYQMLAQARDPMQALQSLVRQNPNLQPLLQMFQRGMNPQQIFNYLCQQRGINPQEFLKGIMGQ